MITPRTDFPATGTMSAQDQHILAALSSKRSLHCNGTQQRRQGPWSWVWVTRTRKTPHIMFYHIFWEPPILRMNTCAKRYVDIPQIPQCLLNSRQNTCFTQLSLAICTVIHASLSQFLGSCGKRIQLSHSLALLQQPTGTLLAPKIWIPKGT